MHPDGQEHPILAASPTDGPVGNERDPTDGVWMTKAQLAAVRRISVASADRLIRGKAGANTLATTDAPACLSLGHGRPSSERRYQRTPRNPRTRCQNILRTRRQIYGHIRRHQSLRARNCCFGEARGSGRKSSQSGRNQGGEAELRADVLRERVEGLLTQLATAEAGALASREQLAAAERRADAERERADRAEAAAAHERQDFLDVEVLTRRELDTLRERLAEAEKGREVAEAAVLQAAQTADEVLQTAAARQRLGLVARLKAAWRGQ